MKRFFVYLASLALGIRGFAIRQDLNEGLVDYYPFNGNTNEQSWNGNHPITKGRPTYINGEIDQGIKFDGDDDCVYRPGDVLTCTSYALPITTREQRVEDHKQIIFNKYSEKQQEFINFVLQHYVNEGVRELDSEKLPDLLKLKYDSIPDAVAQLGNVKEIREMFVGIQEALYSQEAQGSSASHRAN